MELLKKAAEYFKESLKKHGKKKLIENAFIVIIAGVIIIIAGGAFYGKSGNQKKEPISEDGKGTETLSRAVLAEGKTELEKRLEEILSQMKGVGRVSVMITYATGTEIVPAYDVKENENSTKEKDSNGGTRDISEMDMESKIAYEDSADGRKKPIIIKDIMPIVKGVVVIADGAQDPRVKENISKAVRTLMDIPIHKVQVFERK